MNIEQKSSRKMSKREHVNVHGAEEPRGSRHKRRREVGGSSSDVDVTMSDPIEPKAESSAMSKAEVKENGLKIWQTVKDAVKE